MRTKLWAVLVAALTFGCASGGIPKDAKTTIVSFTDLDCSSCGEDMARALISKDGVYKTAFDARRAELTVVADPGVDVFGLATSSKPKDEEWSLVVGAGKGNYLPWTKPKEGLDVKQIAMDGEDVVDLAPHLAAGKVTIVDFSAKWCEPCRTLDEKVLALVEQSPDLGYRKLDIGDWETPLAKRYLTGVKELPYVVVFDGAGRKVGTVTGLDMAGLSATIEKARQAK
ncbi:MAG: thioredoxin family protein [Myxococcales bacterium]|nr:thioredoxin family protein [Myxococcales bacterium]